MCWKSHTDRRCLFPRGVCERSLVRSLPTGEQAPSLSSLRAVLPFSTFLFSQVPWLTHSLSLVCWAGSSPLCCPSSTLASRLRAVPSSSSSPGGTHSSSRSMQGPLRSRPIPGSPVCHRSVSARPLSRPLLRTLRVGLRLTDGRVSLWSRAVVTTTRRACCPTTPTCPSWPCLTTTTSGRRSWQPTRSYKTPAAPTQVAGGRGADVCVACLCVLWVLC